MVICCAASRRVTFDRILHMLSTPPKNIVCMPRTTNTSSSSPASRSFSLIKEAVPRSTERVPGPRIQPIKGLYCCNLFNKSWGHLCPYLLTRAQSGSPMPREQDGTSKSCVSISYKRKMRIPCCLQALNRIVKIMDRPRQSLRCCHEFRQIVQKFWGRTCS
ncbi:hypothetical protein B0H16DRAFT_309083 [Mycena metata]|uniref:Uncharacterized protein n=1 Tax=Mycena metata TaxID=1033252 RepID=A0AAD7P1P5_9AGAR|nr:hypothetical protein B0H16DRAFT_309083 [Mycena metata]